MKKLLGVIFGVLMAFSVHAAVNLNSATQSELETVKGIGPAKAKAIVTHRDKNGPFKSVDDLANVKGFGKSSVDKLKAELTVSAEAKAPESAAKAAAKK